MCLWVICLKATGRGTTGPGWVYDLLFDRFNVKQELEVKCVLLLAWSYLYDVNLLSAIVPHFKLLAVTFDVLCDPHSTHLDTHSEEQQNWIISLRNEQTAEKLSFQQADAPSCISIWPWVSVWSCRTGSSHVRRWSPLSSYRTGASCHTGTGASASA